MRILPLAIVCLAASAAARDRGPALPLATEIGPASQCIPLTKIRETQVRDDRTVDFLSSYGREARGWRVTLPQPCPELGFERRFVYETSLDQLCAGDIITVLHEAPAMRGASCGLAPFQPIALQHR